MGPRVYVVAPVCRAWVTFVRAEDAETATVVAWSVMGLCRCDLKAARYIGGFKLEERSLFGWTFAGRECTSSANGSSN